MSHGRNAWCRACHADYRRQTRSRKREVLRQWRADNPEKVEAWHEKTRESRHLAFVERKYGLSPGEYEVLIEAAAGLCMICGSPPEGRRVRLDVDHCHDSGRVRGLLCNRCNLALGLFRDDPERMYAAIDYLRETA